MYKRLQPLVLIIIMGTTLNITTGCAAKKALEQPDKKDMNVFKEGTPRIIVIQEVGQPKDSQKNDDNTITDTYSFIQGYTQVSKVGRAIGHGIMDILTHGLWEIIGVTTENNANGNKMVLKVQYDKAKLVKKVTHIKSTKTIKHNNKLQR